MSADRAHKLNRRQFMGRASALTAAVALPAEVLSACGGSSTSVSTTSTRGGTLSAGAIDWLPPDFFIGNSLGNGLLSWCQIAWPLFVGGGGDGKGLVYRNGLASGYQVSADAVT